VDYVVILLLQIGSAVASLVLMSIGLAVIFGMMRVINLAHGEFLMLGGYAAITAFNLGVNLWVAMVVVAPLTVGIFGALVERLVIRHLYGRLIDTMLATWGLSLAMIGFVTVVFGNTVSGISAPLGSVSIGAYRTGVYEIFLILVAAILLIAGWLVLRFTRFGLIARGTMQNASMAAALGTNPSAVYAVTFAAGSALSGLAGGLLAPLTGVVPTIGAAYIAKAFITVISGGAAILSGTAIASALLGTINTLATFAFTSVLGEVALLVAALAAGLAVLFGLPAFAETYLIINSTIFAAFAILALSLALIWGYAGILCFGQAAFFGLGGYTYAITAINMGDTTVPAVLAVLLPALFAGMLGYFMFWGRISDVYLGVITLTVSLIFFRFINQTAGEQWNIGDAPLGGFNGIPATPILNWPGRPGEQLAPENIFSLAVGLLIIVYFSCKILLATRFGRIIIAIRENETRAELLGYDVRLYKLAIFMIGGAMAGLSGLLFANSVFVSPTMFSLPVSGQIIIWIIIGGLGTLIGPVIGCILMQILTNYLGTLSQVKGFGWVDPNLVLGVLLVVFVLLVPKGLTALVADGWRWLASLAARPRAVAEPAARERTSNP
jgi:branched-subunit amino acid ABC-type transport system permease component